MDSCIATGALGGNGLRVPMKKLTNFGGAVWQYTPTGLRLHFFVGTSKDGKNRIAQCGLIKPASELHSPTRDGLERCSKCEAEINRPKWK